MSDKDLGSYMQIGEAIRSARRNLGLTQREAANKLGIPVSTYSNYENGNRTPNMDTLCKIAEGFEIDIDQLIKRPTEFDVTGFYKDHHFYFYDKFELEVRECDRFIPEIAVDLLLALSRMNEAGQQVALSRVEELAEIPKYQIKKE